VYQSLAFQHLKLRAYGIVGHAQLGRQLFDAPFAAAQKPDDPAARTAAD